MFKILGRLITIGSWGVGLYVGAWTMFIYPIILA